MTYDSWKAREPLPLSAGYNQRDIDLCDMQIVDGPIVETRVPTEADVAFAQKGYEDADAAWKEQIVYLYGPTYYHVLHTSLARGRTGTDLRKAADAKDIASDHYLGVWNDYLGHRLRDFP